MRVLGTLVAVLTIALLGAPGALAAGNPVANLEVTGAGTVRFDAMDNRDGPEHFGGTCGVPGSAPPVANLANPTGHRQFLCTVKVPADGCPAGQGPSCDLVMEVEARKPNFPQITKAEVNASPAHWLNSGWSTSDAPLPAGRVVSGCGVGQTGVCRFRYGHCEADGCTYDPPVTLIYQFKDIRTPTARFACRLADGSYDPSATCGPPPELLKDPNGTVVFNARSDEYTAGENSTLLCRLDTAAEAPCPAAPGPVVPGTFAYTGLSDGPHTIAVRAIDPSGNAQDPAKAATATFVQRYPPVTTIVSGPAEGSGVASRMPQFQFAADRPATFECRFDSNAWTACSDTFAPAKSLSDGPHTFSVRATRATDQGDIAEAAPPVRHFTVDLVGPDAVIGGGPIPGEMTTNRTATFTLAADPDEPGTTFACRLDSAEPQPCAGTITYPSLPAGPHTFTLTVTDSAGNGHSSTRSWTVIADADQDGSYAPMDDCDDGNPAIRPGAREIPGNGVDEDCDGVDPPNLDVDGDGALAMPQGRDCDDRDANRRPGVADVPGNGIDEDCDGVDTPDLDKDDDGVLVPRDCDDTNAKIRPGAKEKPENGIDEDCDELDGRLEPTGMRFNVVWRLPGRKTTPDVFQAVDVRAGTRLTFRCRGGCTKRSAHAVVRRRRSTLDLRSKIGRRMAPGAVLEVTVAHAGFLTEVYRWTFRAGEGPLRETLCKRRGKVGPCGSGGR